MKKNNKKNPESSTYRTWNDWSLPLPKIVLIIFWFSVMEIHSEDQETTALNWTHDRSVSMSVQWIESPSLSGGGGGAITQLLRASYERNENEKWERSREYRRVVSRRDLAILLSTVNIKGMKSVHHIDPQPWNFCSSSSSLCLLSAWIAIVITSWVLLIFDDFPTFYDIMITMKRTLDENQGDDTSHSPLAPSFSSRRQYCKQHNND